MHFILVVLGNCDTNDAVHVHLGCETKDLRFFYQSPGDFRSVMRHWMGKFPGYIALEDFFGKSTWTSLIYLEYAHPESALHVKASSG